MRAILVSPCASAKEIGRMLGISDAYARTLAKEGRFGKAAFRVGGSGAWRFNVPAIAEMYGLDYAWEEEDELAEGGKAPSMRS